MRKLLKGMQDAAILRIPRDFSCAATSFCGLAAVLRGPAVPDALIAAPAPKPDRAAKPEKPAKPDYSAFKKKLSQDEQVVHALNRLTFGPRPGDVEAVRKMGREESGSTSSFTRNAFLRIRSWRQGWIRSNRSA